MHYARWFLLGHSVTPVNYQHYGRFSAPLELVKDVTLLMSSKDEKTKSPTDTTSVTDAIPQWSLAESSVNPAAFNETTVKCSTCKMPTVHQWIKVEPKPINEPALSAASNDFTVMVEKQRRLILCTQCGLVKTIT